MKKNLILTVFSFLFLSFITYAQTDIEKINLLIEKTKTDKQYSQLSAFVDSLFIKKPVELSEKDYQEIKSIMIKSFDSKIIIDEIKNAFLKNYESNNMNKALIFFDSDLAKFMTGLEIDSLSPEFINKVQAFNINSVSEERKNIIKEVISILKINEQSKKTYLIIIEELFRAYNNFLSSDIKYSEEQIKNRISQLDKDFTLNIEYSPLLTLLVTYDKATNQQIIDYLKFYNSQEGKWMVEILYKAILEGLKRCSIKAGEGIGEFVKSKNYKIKTIGKVITFLLLF